MPTENKNSQSSNIVSVFVEVPNSAFTDDLLEKAASCIDKAISHLDLGETFAVSLTITDDNGIQNLNSEFRGIDRPTDVLSFPQYDFDAPLEPSVPFEYDGNAVVLGDIIVSAETAIRQSEEYGHSLLRELVFLCIHSVLHLFGYDHIEEADRLVMEAKQKEIMTILGIGRE